MAAHKLSCRTPDRPFDAQDVAPVSLKCLDSFWVSTTNMHDGDEKE